jgi:hypothetical protein
MKQLFQDITQGLIEMGYKVHGGNHDTFLILSKNGNVVKVFADNYDKPNHFIVRYSIIKDVGLKIGGIG